MTRPHPIADLFALLDELEARVHASPALAEEWRLAAEGFMESLDDPQARARFREWFLLERPADALGGPPLLAWAPAAPDPDGPWARLLDSFLGIFRLAGTRRVDGRDFLDLEDLWSGRTAHLPADALTADAPDADDLLVVGRLVLADDEVHLPLPGVRPVQAPGLVAALERDLALARHRQPRARLSQRACESLFQLAGSAPPRRPEPAEKLERDLEHLLAAAPEWDTERVRRSLEREGVTGTMDRLAFDSLTDLDGLRRLLPALAEVWSAEEARAAEAAPEPRREDGPADRPGVHAADPEDALASFDRARAAGRSLADAFAELEDALGLEPGTSDEIVPDSDRDRAAIGPSAGTGLRAWIAAYAWEANDDALPRTTLNDFADQVQAQAGRPLDAQDLHASHVLPYLLTSPDGASLRDRRAALHGFLCWAAREQNAPLGAALDDWAAPEDARLPALADAHAAWRQAGRHGSQVQALIELDPPAVADDDQELAAVEGLPAELLGHLRSGDLVVGRWRAGRFIAAGIVPAEAVPARPGSEAGDVTDAEA